MPATPRVAAPWSVRAALTAHRRRGHSRPLWRRPARSASCGDPQVLTRRFRVGNEPGGTAFGILAQACAGDGRTLGIEGRRLAAARQEFGFLHFENRFTERGDDGGEVRLGMRGGEEAGKVVEDMNTAAAHHGEEQVLQRVVLGKGRLPYGSEMHD